MAYKVIVTGATGMVGEGVMHECYWIRKSRKFYL